MARKKKNDFWDDVDETKVVTYTSSSSKESEEEDNEIEDDWSVFKSNPIKVFVRILLMISCFAALISGYVVYQYVQDRYAGGSHSADFFASTSFQKQYNNSIDQLTDLVQAMEADSEVTKAGNEELLATMVENYMGKDTNFSFLIQDSDHYAIVSSGDDAKDRIEASSHYALITNTDGQVSVKSSVLGEIPSDDASALASTKEKYVIYTAVDDQLTYQDSYYSAQQKFDKMADYYKTAKIAAIVAIIIFVICLVFSIMATGQKRGYDGIALSWFDHVFTELAVVIIVGIAGVLLYGLKYCIASDRVIFKAASVALIVLSYGWIARSYFSIVRRIKAGRFFRCSLVGLIVRGFAASFGRLPYPFNAIFEGFFLIIVNAGIAALAVKGRDYEFMGYKVLWIAAGIAIVIELIGILSYATGGMSGQALEEEEDEEDAEQENDDEGSAMEALSAEIEAARQEEEKMQAQTQAQEDSQNEEEEENAPQMIVPNLEMEEKPEWEDMDLGKVIASAQDKQAQENAQLNKDRTIYMNNLRELHSDYEEESQPADQKGKTQVLSSQELEDAIHSSAFENAGPAMAAGAFAGAGAVNAFSPSDTIVNSKPLTQTETPATSPVVSKETKAAVQTPDYDQEVKTADQISEYAQETKAASDVPVKKEAAKSVPVMDADDSGRVNFVQLNKDIRKKYRSNLKSRGIVVTMRAPEKPVIIDIDESSLSILISNIFEQIERLSADNVRNYLESYVQDGKVVYIARINVADSMRDAATAAVSDTSFDSARKIAEANDGKFVVSYEGTILRVGMLIDAAS